MRREQFTRKVHLDEDPQPTLFQEYTESKTELGEEMETFTVLEGDFNTAFWKVKALVDSISEQHRYQSWLDEYIENPNPVFII